MILPDSTKCRIAIIGMGYVGLPLAAAFASAKRCARTKQPLDFQVIGFDINTRRLNELSAGFDRTSELTEKDLLAATSLSFSSSVDDLNNCDVFIITVPTPVDQANIPDLTALRMASRSVGMAMGQRAAVNRTSPVVIYESTVYPGATEEVCVPVLEQYSGMKFNTDFFCGYSPERINPGDKSRNLTSITKVTSGSTAESAKWIDDFYGSIILAGTHRAASLKVAEAAKVIENTQRDLNIALINELSMIFKHLDIDTLDVLSAAGTKWNFLKFKPGLVGGHCIGVDPYYLTYKAEVMGYHPQVVLAGRRINDGYANWVASEIIKTLCRTSFNISTCKILVMGITFKEGCPDLRNSKVVDLINCLKEFGPSVDVVDPCASPEETQALYDITLRNLVEEPDRYSAVIVAVGHEQYASMGSDEWSALLHDGGIIFDLKGLVPRKLKPVRF